MQRRAVRRHRAGWTFQDSVEAGVLGAIAKLPSSVDLRRDQGFGFVKPAYIKAACYPESYGAVD